MKQPNLSPSITSPHTHTHLKCAPELGGWKKCAWGGEIIKHQTRKGGFMFATQVPPIPALLSAQLWQNHILNPQICSALVPLCSALGHPGHKYILNVVWLMHWQLLFLPVPWFWQFCGYEFRGHKIHLDNLFSALQIVFSMDTRFVQTDGRI
uniref:Uncharacterized protein n=1 Tax=Sphaerodactylus townsendi TaxID=933632 RepID=A0ACB8FHF3_9SAUR